MICLPRGDDQIKSDMFWGFEPGSLAESRRATPVQVCPTLWS